MPYYCLRQQTYEEGLYRLVPIRKDDMEAIRSWRNEQMIILRQDRPLTEEDQRRYWERVLKPSFGEEKPVQILFSMLKNNELIGYGGVTHIDWNAGRAEVSFLLETSRKVDKVQYQKEFEAFLVMIKRAAFGDLNFHRLYTETFDLRPAHVAVLESSGFKREGVLKDHVKVENKYCDSLIHGFVRDESA